MKKIHSLSELSPMNESEAELLSIAVKKGINIGCVVNIEDKSYILDNAFFTGNRKHTERVLMGSLKGVNATRSMDLNDTALIRADKLMQTCQKTIDIIIVSELKDIKCEQGSIYDMLTEVVDPYMTTANVYYYIKDNYEKWSLPFDDEKKLVDWLDRGKNYYPYVLASRISALQLSNWITNNKRGIFTIISEKYGVTREAVRFLIKKYQNKYPELNFNYIENEKDNAKGCFNNVLVRFYISDKMEKNIETYFAENGVTKRTSFKKFWKLALESFLENPTEISGEYIMKGDCKMLDKESRRSIPYSINITPELRDRLDEYVVRYNQKAEHVQPLRGKGKIILQAVENYLKM